MGKFEENLHRLEEISTLLRNGGVELDKATDLFEEGIKLAQVLEKELNKVERKIEILVNKPTTDGDTPVLELFPEIRDLQS
ncbi:MAG: exodeoxyribonuclease VII small subunit [Spirochaetales bacterium]|nr:exodeoxyribonuclease VII small subunit [Spirochaetales bacterium]